MDLESRGGVHADGVRYDYRTELAPGNLAEDGSACGFGGCLYTAAGGPRRCFR